MWRKLLSVAVLVLGLPASALADVRLPRIFTDHMVLQQDLPIRLWGWAQAGEEIVVQIARHKETTRADQDGSWQVTLPALKADGTAHTLSIRGNNVLELRDVLVGEVWLCSGQSNMGQPVDGAAAKTADFPRLRLFNSSGQTPRRHDLDQSTPWTVCSPTTLLQTGDPTGPKGERRGFSEVAYHFGLGLHKALDVPIGLIQVNCGGSTAKDWTYLPEVAARVAYDQPIDKITHQAGLLYQVRLHGLAPFPVRGVIWYQGEDDGRNEKYADDFQALIEGWRQRWGRPDLPFYYAQIAPTTYSGGMLKVWEAQRVVMARVPHTGMAVSNDIYDGTTNGGFQKRLDKELSWPIVGGGNPHPTGKPRIAGRLADIALAHTYGRKGKDVFGPTYRSHEVRGDKVLVRFAHVGAGLTTADGEPPDWFEVAEQGPDGEAVRYHKAEAKIVDVDTVAVSAPAVREPREVRFGWHTLARFNLTNRDGLPAVPFRTGTDK